MGVEGEAGRFYTGINKVEVLGTSLGGRQEDVIQ